MVSINVNMEDSLLVTLKISELKSILEEIIEEKLNVLKSSIQESTSFTKFMSRQEVADLFKVSLVSIDKWKKHGILPKPIKQSGRVYFLREEIEQLIQDKIGMLWRTER